MNLQLMPCKWIHALSGKFNLPANTGKKYLMTTEFVAYNLILNCGQAKQNNFSFTNEVLTGPLKQNMKDLCVSFLEQKSSSEIWIIHQINQTGVIFK